MRRARSRAMELRPCSCQAAGSNGGLEESTHTHLGVSPPWREDGPCCPCARPAGASSVTIMVGSGHRESRSGTPTLARRAGSGAWERMPDDSCAPAREGRSQSVDDVDGPSTSPGVERSDLLPAEAAATRAVELDGPPVHPADSRCPPAVRAVLPGDPLTRFHRVASRAQRAGWGREGLRPRVSSQTTPLNGHRLAPM